MNIQSQVFLSIARSLKKVCDIIHQWVSFKIIIISKLLRQENPYLSREGARTRNTNSKWYTTEDSVEIENENIVVITRDVMIKK